MWITTIHTHTQGNVSSLYMLYMEPMKAVISEGKKKEKKKQKKKKEKPEEYDLHVSTDSEYLMRNQELGHV